MSQLIRYFDPVSEMKETEAYLYATGVVLCSASFSITERFYTFQMKHIGMQIRVASCSLIFKKVYHMAYCHHYIILINIIVKLYIFNYR